MQRFTSNILLFCLLLLITFIRFYTLSDSYGVGDSVRVVGRISNDPVGVGDSQKLEVGKFVVYPDRAVEYRYGEKIEIVGKIAEGKTGRLTMKNPEISKVEQLNSALLVFRERVLKLYRENLPEPHSALLAGVVLGTKSSLENDFFEALRKSSTLHIVVASGTNVAIFGGSALAVLAPYMGRRRAVFVAITLVFAYVAVVGLQPPIVRAALMGSVAFLAPLWGRRFSSFKVLSLVAFVMLFLDPELIFDVGFQLSFAAMFGVLYIAPWFEERLTKLPNFIRGDFSTSLGAQAVVSPVIYYHFGQISFIGPFVNILILWLIPFVMFGGLIMATLGLLWEPLGVLAGWFMWLPLEYMVRIIEFFGR